MASKGVSSRMVVVIVVVVKGDGGGGSGGGDSNGCARARLYVAEPCVMCMCM